MIPYSFLDLAYVKQGFDVKDTFKELRLTAQLAEQSGYNRFWLAEHHNMEGVASSSTAVLIGYVAGQTQYMRVGSGGIMLPNHSPLAVAEAFGTLAALYPNRIDLGLGRAPGTDTLTAQFLRPDFYENAQRFPQHVDVLHRLFSADNATSKIRAIPGEGEDVPIWILGSSMDSAKVAAAKGLPYAFASHFAPGQMKAAFEYYKNNFQPSEYLDKPYVMSCVNVIIGQDQEEARFLATSLYQSFVNIIRNTRGKSPAPNMQVFEEMTDTEAYHLDQMLHCTFIGSKKEVAEEIQSFIHGYALDEIMISSPIYDAEKRRHSIQSFAEMMHTK